MSTPFTATPYVDYSNNNIINDQSSITCAESNDYSKLEFTPLKLTPNIQINQKTNNEMNVNINFNIANNCENLNKINSSGSWRQQHNFMLNSEQQIIQQNVSTNYLFN
jgi:hypothetical protein